MKIKVIFKFIYRVVIVLEAKIFVYNFNDLKMIDHIETCSNPKGCFYNFWTKKKKNYLGLCSLNNDPDLTVLACPDKQVGHVELRFYGKIINDVSYDINEFLIYFPFMLKLYSSLKFNSENICFIMY